MYKAHLPNAGLGKVKRSFLESLETKDNNVWPKCRGLLNVNADGTNSNDYALEVHIIIGNCIQINAAMQQVEIVARELPDARMYSRRNTKALYSSPTED